MSFADEQIKDLVVLFNEDETAESVIIGGITYSAIITFHVEVENQDGFVMPDATVFLRRDLHPGRLNENDFIQINNEDYRVGEMNTNDPLVWEFTVNKWS